MNEIAQRFYHDIIVQKMEKVIYFFSALALAELVLIFINAACKGSERAAGG